MTYWKICPMLAGAALLLVSAASASASLVASYDFNNTLSTSVGSAPDLTAVDPLGQNQFVTDTVFSQSRTVYSFSGNASPNSDQAGLTLDTTGLVATNDYSVAMVFKFTQNANAWRRILDTLGSSSDSGFYVDPSNHLDIFPVGAGSDTFSNDDYHLVVLTDDNGTATFSLDGQTISTFSTTEMDINNPMNLFGFFLDNSGGSATTEYSSGDVALINIYDSALSAGDITDLAADPFPPSPVPEPATLALVGIGLGGVGLLRKRRTC